MKKLLFTLLIIPITLLGVQTKSETDTSVVLILGITKHEAEKILGQAVESLGEKKEVKGGIIKKRSTHIGLENEPGTNRVVRLDCALTKYMDIDQVKKGYSQILKANRNMTGGAPITDIGDEAWFHSDGKNFCLIMVRKTDELLVIKVNKMTKKFSLIELKKVVKRIVSSLR